MGTDRVYLALIIIVAAAWVTVTICAGVEASNKQNAQNIWYASNGYSCVVDQKLGKMWVKQSDIMKLQISVEKQ